MGFPCHFTVLHLHVVVGAHGKILALFPAPGCIGISQGRGQCFVKEHFASWKLFWSKTKKPGRACTADSQTF